LNGFVCHRGHGNGIELFACNDGTPFVFELNLRTPAHFAHRLAQHGLLDQLLDQPVQQHIVGQ